MSIADELPVVSVSEISRLAEQYPGLIPIDLDAATRRVTWCDLGEYHCHEGFFRDSLTLYSGMLGRRPERFISDFESLGEVVGQGNYIAPGGFIFHAGRCGSTLLAKALARSRRNLMFSETAPHNQFWKLDSLPGESRIENYRRLIYSMGRRRVRTHQSHLIKFTSFNIVRYSFIRVAFPETPALFLFRDPESLLHSWVRGRPGWLGLDLGDGMRWDQPESAIEAFFRAATAIHDPLFRCLEYKNLTPQILPAVVRYFGIEADPEDLRLMASEFSWDSKAGLTPRPFSIREAPGKTCPDTLRALHQSLRSSGFLLD